MGNIVRRSLLGESPAACLGSGAPKAGQSLTRARLQLKLCSKRRDQAQHRSCPGEEPMMRLRSRRWVAALSLGLAVAVGARAGSAQETHRYRFAYDQPHSSGYGIAGDVFAAKLAALSKNTMAIDQFPGAQLGQQPQILQLIRSGDIDFAITSSTNSATLSPQAGTIPMHFLSRAQDHISKQ